MDENVDVKKRLIDALKKLDTVMVTTFAENGTMHARPMVLGDIGSSCDLWFVTAKSSEKTHEVQTDSRAVVTGQGRGLYVSVSGQLDVIEDPAKVRALWKETWRAWFPKGKEDPNIVLLRLRPEIGEYWDQGAKGLRFLFEAAKAIVNGKRVEADPKQHAKVPM